MGPSWSSSAGLIIVVGRIYVYGGRVLEAGVRVGFAVGVYVGGVVGGMGASDGDSVGDSVGISVGDSVGISTGVFVGWSVASSSKTSTGASVGASDGSSTLAVNDATDGAVDGVVVGVVVGDVVVIMVGAGVIITGGFPSGVRPYTTIFQSIKLLAAPGSTVSGLRSLIFSSHVPVGSSPQFRTVINCHRSSPVGWPLSGRFPGCRMDSVPNGDTSVTSKSPRLGCRRFSNTTVDSAAKPP
mmetsp:Transcript_26210/g.61591  ORF Transcript_26210/g.61591 Transcript_26210/m.61591 type:complete len:241 (-) Transcript_26210:1814-2536(-)